MNQAIEGIQEIQEIRSKTVNYALVAAAFLAVPALMGGLARTAEIGWQNIFYFHIGALLLIWVMAALRNRLSFRIRASFVLTLLLALGIGDLLSFGLVALGSLLLMGFCIMATSLYGIRGVVASLTLSAAVITAIGWGVQTGAVVFTVDANAYQIGVTSWVQLGVILVLVTGIVSSVIAVINHRMVNAINVLRETTIELIETNKRLETEISIRIQKEEELRKVHDEEHKRVVVAGEFQKSLLPKVTDLSFLQADFRYFPVGSVSGDVYHLSQGRDGEVEFFLGDATGHDVAAALLSMMAHIGLESARDLNSTGAVIGQLNSLLAPMGLMEKFITGIFLRIGADGLLRACNAGHPPLFIIPAREIEPMRLSEGGVPLGLFSEPPVPYSEQVYQLEVGDRFFLLTDGVIEWENPEGEQFGMDRVLEFLSNRRHDRISELLQGLMEELHQFSDRRPCGDDMTLFAFQYQGRMA